MKSNRFNFLLNNLEEESKRSINKFIDNKYNEAIDELNSVILFKEAFMFLNEGKLNIDSNARPQNLSIQEYNNYYNLKESFINKKENREPIYQECFNKNIGCYCTGKCKIIIGYKSLNK